jgi:hypothetical protein
VEISGSYAYLATGEGSLWVLDISNPTSPVAVGFYDAPGYAKGVAVSGGYAYVADGEAGLRVLDVSNPANPVEVGFYDTPSEVRNVAVSGNTIYLVDSASGLIILRLTAPLEDTGFLPGRSGYSFPNYGAKDYGDYTFPDMQHMFGESAVYWTTGAGREAKALASLWNTQSYQMMNKGHSYGMAVSGLRFFKDIDTHPEAASVYELDKSSEVLLAWEGESISITLRRDIGFFTVSQFAEPLRSAIHQSIDLTPAEVFTQIQASMSGGAPDPLALLMIKQDTGHALIPYAITSPNPDVYWVWVYDSEHPGDDERVMTFDLLADSWSYDTGNGVWSGDAVSHSLGVIPTSAHSQLLECPWCTSSHLLTLEGDGRLLVTDSQGRRLGYTASQYVEEIPGAYGLAPILGTGNTHEPLYTLPLTDTYTILLDGQTVSQTAPASLWQFGPGYAVSVQDLNVGPGTYDELSIGADGTLLSYHASQPQEPALTLALDVLTATYGLGVQWLDIGAGEAVTLTVDTALGTLVLDGSQASGGMYNLLIRKASETGGFSFYHSDIEILATDTHILHFGAWDGFGAITLEIDHGSDGTIDETLVLVNQVVWAYLPNLSK